MDKRQRSIDFLARAAAAAGASLFFAACTVVPFDYSSVTGTNYLYGLQFDNVAWVADNGTDMNFTQVSAADGSTNPSGDNWAGYTNAVFTDLQAAAATSTLPIYRLETINLFQNGDLEAGNISYTPIGTTNDNRVSASTIGSEYSLHGYWLEMNFQDSSAGLQLAAASNITGFAGSGHYALGFKYLFQDTFDYYLSVDNASENSTSADLIKLKDAPEKTEYRYPFIVPSGTGLQGINPDSGTRPYLYINSHASSNSFSRPFKGAMDDFQAVRSDLDNAIRITIPWTAAGRADLQAGGHYVFKMYIRRDLTSTYSGPPAHQNNRFDADFLSVAFGSAQGGNGTNNNWVVHSIGSSAAWQTLASGQGWSNHANVGNWTLVTAVFAGPASPQSASGMQIAISATNAYSSALRSPGSLLIAYPQLYWTAN